MKLSCPVCEAKRRSTSVLLRLTHTRSKRVPSAGLCTRPPARGEQCGELTGEARDETMTSTPTNNSGTSTPVKVSFAAHVRPRELMRAAPCSRHRSSAQGELSLAPPTLPACSSVSVQTHTTRHAPAVLGHQPSRQHLPAHQLVQGWQADAPRLARGLARNVSRPQGRRLVLAALPGRLTSGDGRG